MADTEPKGFGRADLLDDVPVGESPGEAAARERLAARQVPENTFNTRTKVLLGLAVVIAAVFVYLIATGTGSGDGVATPAAEPKPWGVAAPQ